MHIWVPAASYGSGGLAPGLVQCCARGAGAPLAWRRRGSEARSGAVQAVGDLIRAILGGARLQGWQIGTTRVFLRAGQLAALEVPL